MNYQKICFILCANDELLARECQLYIEQLIIPEDFELETIVVYDAQSMTSGYNGAMKESDAKYKVYLHQDVLLIYKKFIVDIVSLFTKHPQIGMLGVVGNTSLPEDGCPWSDGMDRRIGELYSDLIYRKEYCVFSKIKEEYQHAVVLDGLLMATQYDLPWREDLFGGWDFYDCSQSLEFWKAGYQVVVPHMEDPWCLHDNDILHLQDYEKWRRVFEREYKPYYFHWEKGEELLDRFALCKTEEAQEKERLQKKEQRIKRLIYQKYSQKSSRLDVPYPPIYREKDAEYICFTDSTKVHSQYWRMEYVEMLEDDILSEYLVKYQECFELLPNQIQIGSVFSKDGAYEPIITVPSLEEIPEVTFDVKKILPTADKEGNYQFSENPCYQKGKYDGRPLLLTIGVPVSNQITTIDRCLSHVKPLLDKLDAELLVVDTGSTDGTIDVCKKYGARIISYAWCDNMSAVRNAGIYHAMGEWYLSIDDDEWFENVEGILSFFQKGMYKKCDTATYIQRNYHTFSGETWSDNHVLRMAKITPRLHFEGRIHDSMIVPADSKNCMLFSYVHHYGFVRDDYRRTKEKYIRNTSILLYDVYEYPKNLRYNFQLANELKCQMYTEETLAYFFRGISLETEIGDIYFGKHCVVNLLAALYDFVDKRLLVYTKLLQRRYELTLAENAFLNYIQASLAVRYHHPAEEILRFCEEYEKYREKFEKNPYYSQLNTYIGLHVCTNKPYIMDSYVMKFCAYCALKKTEKALKELEKIIIDEVVDQRRAFWETFVIADDRIFEAVLDKIVPREYALYLEELLDAFCVSICHLEITEQQFKRLSLFVKKVSIRGLQNYLQKSYRQLTEDMRELFFEYAVNRGHEECSVQELYLLSYVLKQAYYKTGRERKDLELFKKYICFTGLFAVQCYNLELLEDKNCFAVPADVHAAYFICQSLRDDLDLEVRVLSIRKALKRFPAFCQEIKAISSKMIEEEKKVVN